jgi:autotransporter-associated beta strand protein
MSISDRFTTTRVFPFLPKRGWRATTVLATAAASVTMYISQAAQANTPYSVNSGATDLAASASYTPTGMPGASGDVTFTNVNYSKTNFNVTSNLSFGTLNSLDTTNTTLIVRGTGANASHGTSLALDGGSNSVASANGGSAGDLIFVVAGATLNLANQTNYGFASLNLSSGGNLDIAGTASIDPAITGAGTTTIVKTGAGTLTLNNNASTFTGNVVVVAGTLKAGSNGAALQYPTATNVFTVNGGSVDFNGKSGFYVGVLNGSGGSLINSGTNTANLNIFGGATGTYFGSITGGVQVNVSGDSSSLFETLAGTNTYTGPTTVTNGTLEFATPASLYNANTSSWTASIFNVAGGTNIVFNVGGPHDFSVTQTETLLPALANNSTTNGLQPGSFFGFDTTNTTLPVVYPGSVTDSNAGMLGIAKFGANTLSLSGSNTYSGGTRVYAGTLDLTNPSAAGTGGLNFQAASNIQLSSDTAFGGSSPILNVNLTNSGTYTGTFILNRATSGAMNSLTHQFGTLTITLYDGGNGGLNVLAGPNAPTGGFVDTLAFNNLLFGNYANSSTETLNPTGTYLTIGQAAPVTGAQGNYVATLDLDGTSPGNQITGTISDTANGGSTIRAAIVKTNSSVWTLSGSNSYSGGTSINAGLLVASSGLPALGTGPVTINGGGIILRNTSAGTVFPMLSSGYNGGSWNGTSGILSNTASADSAHLHAVGELQPNVATTFEAQPLGTGDVALKYTYYGDANLDGTVDGSDYSLIDNGYQSESGAHPLTGWQNGDFNYDGVVNGSDYTLMDNAFNSQGVQIASQVARVAAQIAGAGTSSAVPEPAALGLLGFTFACLLGRRHRVR